MGITDDITNCHCNSSNATRADKVKGDTLFAPLKGKMKVLKKIKKRMGLASRSSCNGHGTNNLPPLLFHKVCGENIKVSHDGTVARRAESFCKGIAFSSRPVKVNEKVCIKFLEISNNWSGVIRFGFSYNDPSTLRDGALPKYACPDLTNKPGYWAKALPERFCNQGTVLFYYVTAAGDVHFGINQEEKGIFFSGVETRGPLWALIDVYGNSTAIEFVDVRHQLNNSRRSESSSGVVVVTPDEVERIICPMQNVNINNRNGEAGSTEDVVVQHQFQLRYQPHNFSYTPMPLHRTRGRNVRFNANRSEAARVDSEFCQGYVFTGRPLQLGERIVIQILSTVPMFQGCLGLGLTSCDPALLQPGDLPDDSNFLLDRPEYWVISRDFARNLNVGDEISFMISGAGEVQISRNGGPPSVVIHVDQTLKLWAFFDVYGSTRRIRVLSHSNAVPTTTPTTTTTPTRNNGGEQHNNTRRILTPNSESMNSLNSQSELRRNNNIIQTSNGNSRMCDIQVQPSANGGAVLSVILPPSHVVMQQQPQGITSQYSSQNSVHSSQVLINNQHHANGYHSSGQSNLPYVQSQSAMISPVLPAAIASQSVAALPTGTMMSSCSNTYIEPISSSIGDITTVTTTSSSNNNTNKTWLEQNGTGGAYSAGAECTICYEKPIDAVLYMCGHMCMCYECALQQWRGKGGGQCPLCRAVIRDVIRTYKS